MGKLLHRCWAPFLLAEEIAEPDCPPVRIKLMGERLAKAGSAWSTSSAKPQRVRSVAIEFCQGVSFSEGAKHGLYAELGTEPLSA